MICRVELESEPELKKWFLENLLVNPSGQPGHVQEGDLLVEHVNGGLQDHIHHKDVPWDGPYLRDLVSPNIFRLDSVKKGAIEALGLKRKSASHTRPHTRAEFRILLDIYKDNELHYFRAARDYGVCGRSEGKDVADYERGVQDLQNGKLEKFKSATTERRNLIAAQQQNSSSHMAPDTANEIDNVQDQTSNHEPSESGSDTEDELPSSLLARRECGIAEEGDGRRASGEEIEPDEYEGIEDDEDYEGSGRETPELHFRDE